MLPVRRNPSPLPRTLPKGVRLVYREIPPGGFTTGRNPHPKGSTEWVAFERLREQNWDPWLWEFASFKAFLLFQAHRAAERDQQ